MSSQNHSALSGPVRSPSQLPSPEPLGPSSPASPANLLPFSLTAGNLWPGNLWSADFNRIPERQSYEALPPLVGLPRWLSGKEPTYQCRKCRRHRFDPWVRKIPWRRKWQPTLVFLPEKSCGQRSMVGCSPWGCKESDMTEWACTHTHTHTHTHTL